MEGSFTSQTIRQRLAGQHILITGSTGFLAKALVEKLLRSVDTIGGLHLLVRARSDGVSPAHRVRTELLNSRGFDRLRAALGERSTALFNEKVHVVGGDLTQNLLGIDPSVYEELTHKITLVINSAATVTFDERLDHAVELNTKGPARLLKFAQDCGDVPFLHVSTCYVCGARRGIAVEDFSAPEQARELLPRIQTTGEFDLDALIQSLLASATHVRLRLGADTEACRRELIDEGMRAARAHGWNDTYTFTKWIGEQLLLRDRGKVPLCVFRPAIIEGSYDEPMPGWIDGLRMADPIIVAYGKGKLDEFPGRADIPIDFIPVDFVVNAMIAALPATNLTAPASPHSGNGRPPDQSPTSSQIPVRLYQCASSERNPLRVGDLAKWLEETFTIKPMRGDDGKPVRVKPLRFVDQSDFLQKWRAREISLERTRTWLERLRIGRNRIRKLTALSRQIEQVIYFAKIYAPYTDLECRFADDNLRQLAANMHPRDREFFPFDPTAIDWRDYLVNRHVPGLRTFVLQGSAEPSPRILGGPSSLPKSAEAVHPPPANLFDAFSQSARRFKDKTAFRLRRNGKWLIYSYEQALDATGAIMQRLLERGIKPSDRVAICAENSPEWCLAYLSLMRAGVTAVPIDPQLPASDVLAAAEFAEARLVLAGRTTFDALSAASTKSDPTVLSMTEPLIPTPGAARDARPQPVQVDADAVASILFTSGTTLTPKAVPLTHANLLANATSLKSIFPLCADDEFLSVLPMYHAFEFTGGFLVPIMLGASITYVDQLKGAEITSAMQATGTTIMLVVPRLLRMFHDSIQGALAGGGIANRTLFNLVGLASRAAKNRYARTLFAPIHRSFGGHLRMFVSGGASLAPDLFRYFERLGIPVYEGYGLTETSPVLTLNPFELPRLASVGIPLPDVDLEVRNQNPEGIGEVWARGPNVMSGYLNDPQSSAEVLVDGWFRTGDLGRKDPEGYLFLTGRSKDLIITDAGKNVYPDEVEALYRELPFVKELCVFGVPATHSLGDIVHAVAVLDSSAAPILDRSSIEREIRVAAENIAARIAAYQRIAVFHFWDHELPKTTTLKAKRGLIRDQVRAGTSPPAEPFKKIVEPARNKASRDQAATVENQSAFDALRKLVIQQHPAAGNSFDPSAHLLLDLGIDSIGKIDLIGAVESTFNLKIDDATAAKISRISDFLTVIGDRRPADGKSRVSNIFSRFAGAGGDAAVNGHLSPSLLPARWIARGALGLFMHSYLRVRVTGRQHLPANGPFIIAPNHSSHLDAPAVLTAVAGRRRVFVAGAEDYFFTTPLRKFTFGRLFDTIPFDRHADGLEGLRRCGEVLARGHGVLIFPEGTRSLTGILQNFKIGVAVLAVEHKAPVIPVYIARSFNLLPKGSRFARPGVIRVAFGQPILPPADTEVADPYTRFQIVTRRIEKAVHALSRQVTD